MRILFTLPTLGEITRREIKTSAHLEGFCLRVSPFSFYFGLYYEYLQLNNSGFILFLTERYLILKFVVIDCDRPSERFGWCRKAFVSDSSSFLGAKEVIVTSIRFSEVW